MLLSAAVYPDERKAGVLLAEALSLDTGGCLVPALGLEKLSWPLPRCCPDALRLGTRNWDALNGVEMVAAAAVVILHMPLDRGDVDLGKMTGTAGTRDVPGC